MLCKRCSGLARQDHRADWTFIHYSSYTDLKQSAESGCQGCQLLKSAMLLQFAHGLPSNLETAESYHLAIDLIDQFEKDRNRSKFTAHNRLADLDDNKSRLNEGSYSFHFVREVQHEDSLPLREIYTQIALESIQDDPSSGIVGKKINPEPSLQIAQSWFLDCMNGHDPCGHSIASPLPTRVLAVGPPDGSEEPRLELSNGRTGRYATLSHRWGGSKPISLNEDTYPSFLNQVALSTLPKTFQDAVIVTRHLDIPFLWIDSLCIFQDSREDWAHECVKMPGIYRNSQVNIAASSAINTEAGFLHPRAPLPLPVVELEWKGANEQSPQTIRWSYYPPDTELEPCPEENSTLRTRAWVLQERLLSPRTIYFGVTKTYFECLANVRYENILYPVLDYYQMRDEVKKVDFSADYEQRFWLRTWYELISTYTATNLTFQTDRLPAISGVAREISRKLSDDYLAGLWKGDIVTGLTWHIEGYITEIPPLVNSSTYIAPSWSWASSKASVTYQNFVEQLDTTASQCQLSGISVEPATVDQYGAVMPDAYIEIQGRTFDAKLSPGRDRWVPDRRAWFASLVKSKVNLGRYYSDDTSWNNTSLPPSDEDSVSMDEESEEEGSTPCTFLYLGQFDDRLVALAIEEASTQPQSYRRRGLLLSEREGASWNDALESSVQRTVKLM